MNIHPAEYAKMTKAQRELAAKLRDKHWHFSMMYYRCAYFHISETVPRSDGTWERIESIRTPCIKVTPSGRIVRVEMRRRP